MVKVIGYIDIIHDQKSVVTMKDFIAFYHIDEITSEKLFDDNRDNILAAMSLADKYTYMFEHGLTGVLDTLTADKLDPEMALPRFAKIRVYYTNIRQENVIYISNVKAKITNYAKWADEQLLAITDSNGFRSEGNVVTKEYRKMAPNIRVCGWFKALEFANNEREDAAKTSALRDISRFIGSMSVNTTKNGGNFTFSVPHVAIENAVKSDYYSTRGNYVVGAEIEDKSYYKTTFADDSERNEDDYFNWLISPNDLIFLRFEKTVEEINDDLNNRTGEPQLRGDVWDMIGLVDSVSISTDAQGVSSNVTVKGRDLMKLLIDDGSFFFPVAMDLGARELFSNTSGVSVTGGGDGLGVINCKNAVNRLLGRNVSGVILPFMGNMYTLEFVLKEVINWLSNIAIVPDYIFNPWEDDRTTMVDIEPPAPEDPKKNVK